MAKFCSNCGTQLTEQQDVCLKCGIRINKGDAEVKTASNTNAKSKVVAGLLALFFGNIGVHNFYLGYTNKAVAQLLLTLLGIPLALALVGFFMIFAAIIWAFIEAILIFTGIIDKDADGVLLKD